VRIIFEFLRSAARALFPGIMAVTSVISLPLLWTFPVQLIFGTHATCIPVQNSYHSRVCFIALCCGSEKYFLTVLSAFNVAGGVFTTQPTVPQGGDYSRVHFALCLGSHSLCLRVSGGAIKTRPLATRNQKVLYISHGTVATYLRYGGTCNDDDLIRNVLLNFMVKIFQNSKHLVKSHAGE